MYTFHFLYDVVPEHSAGVTPVGGGSEGCGGSGGLLIVGQTTFRSGVRSRSRSPRAGTSRQKGGNAGKEVTSDFQCPVGDDPCKSGSRKTHVPQHGDHFGIDPGQIEEHAHAEPLVAEILAHFVGQIEMEGGDSPIDDAPESDEQEESHERFEGFPHEGCIHE